MSIFLLDSHGKDLNGAPIDHQLAILGLHCALELSVGGVILEQVHLCELRCVTQAMKQLIDSELPVSGVVQVDLCKLSCVMKPRIDGL